jgi:hypothetical protein
VPIENPHELLGLVAGEENTRVIIEAARSRLARIREANGSEAVVRAFVIGQICRARAAMLKEARRRSGGRDRDGVHAFCVANSHARGDASHVADLLVDNDEVGCQLGDGLKDIDACSHSVDGGRIIGQSGIDLFENPVSVGSKKDGGHGADSTGWRRFRPTIGSGRALGGEPLGKGREAI